MKTLSMLVAILTFASCSLAEGQVVRSYDLDEDGFQLSVAELTLTPRPVSDTPSRFRLKVMADERTVGNAAIVYARAFTDYSYYKNDRLNFKEFKDVYSDWSGSSVSLKDIPLEKLKIAAGRFDKFISQHIAAATTCEKCDWGYSVVELSGTKLFSLQLDEIHASNGISWTLVLQTRVAILEKRFGDAAELLRMHYTLAQNVAKLPGTGGTISAVSLFSRANKTLLEFCSAPDAPNMYWAISQLPSPLFSGDEAMEMELSIYEEWNPEFKSVEHAQLSEDQWKLMGQKIFREFVARRAIPATDTNQPSEGEIAAEADAAFLAASLKGMAAAKRRLRDSGTSDDQLNAMSVAQIMLVDARREYVKDKAKFHQSIYLPVPSLIKFDRQWNDDHQPSANESNLGKKIFESYRPIHVKSRIAEVQSELDLIRVIEAIRMHALRTGKLPSELAELESVPIPNNPITGEPFAYQVTDGTAEFKLPIPSQHSHSKFIVKLHSVNDETQRGSNE